MSARGAVDLNCDLGEGSGWDLLAMPWITSANIACGGHAGDLRTVERAALQARLHGVGAGAHPGYEDREGFGRREIGLSPDAIRTQVIRQLALFTEAAGAPAHVKPHGALYNRTAVDPGAARAVAEAVAQASPGSLLFAPAGSALEDAGRVVGLRVVREGFADRAYLADGSLAPRHLTGAVLADTELAAAQALDLVLRGGVRSLTGEWCRLPVETLCVHGDGRDPVGLARGIRGALASARVEVRRAGP